MQQNRVDFGFGVRVGWGGEDLSCLWSGFCPESLDQEFCSDVCEEEYAQAELEDWLLLPDEI